MVVDYHRKSIRLRTVNYAEKRIYFVTFGAYKHACIFGKVADGVFLINEIGKIALRWYGVLPIRFSNVLLREIQLMPNHIHCLIEFKEEVVGVYLGNVVAYWKYNLTKEVNSRGGVAPPLFEKNWSHLFEGKILARNYYEHIVRNSEDLKQKIEYIISNPKNWDKDVENQYRRKKEPNL